MISTVSFKEIVESNWTSTSATSNFEVDTILEVKNRLNIHFAPGRRRFNLEGIEEPFNTYFRGLYIQYYSKEYQSIFTDCFFLLTDSRILHDSMRHSKVLKVFFNNYDESVNNVSSMVQELAWLQDYECDYQLNIIKKYFR